MTLLPALLVAGFVTAGASLVLPSLLRRAHLLDHPGPRSSHVAPTARGGGIAVLAGLVAGAAVWVASADAAETVTVPWVVLAVGTGLAAGAIGLADDVYGVPPGVRLAAQLVVGAAAGLLVVRLLGVSPVWVAGAALCMAAYVNVTNFMDGVNTFAAGQGAAAGVSYASAGLLWSDARAADGPGTAWLVPVGLLLAVCCLSFTPSNGLGGPPARLFLGDVGSYAIGACVAVLAGAGFLTGLPLLAACAPLTIQLADTGHTLLLRAAAGERVAHAHRTHAYQRLTDSGWSHRAVSAVAAGASLLCAAVGVGASLVVRSGVSASSEMVTVVGAVLLLVAVGWTWVKLPAWRGAPSPWGRLARERIRGPRR